MARRLASAAFAVLFAAGSCAAPVVMPKFEGLKKAQWNALSPGGQTTCSDGSPFQFFVWPGSRSTVVLNFLDGGGCWNTQTCRDLKWYTRDTQAALEQLGPGAKVRPEGLINMTDARNPVKDATHVVITYCTADIHWGDKVSTYGDVGHSVTLRHKGAVNAKAVLDWVYANVPSPDAVLSTGCSAGSSGAIMWGAHAMEHYPQARHVVLGDSGAGIIPQGFLANTLATWNGAASFPAWISGFDADHIKSIVDVYALIGKAYPKSQLSQVDNMKDRVQSKFYGLMVGDVNIPTATWARLMVEGKNDIAARVPNFDAYLVDVDGAADFDTHCIINKDEFFALAEFDGARDVKIADWLRDMLAGKPVGDVRCPTCTL